MWRWSRRNPKLVGAAAAGVLLGAAAVSLFRGEISSVSQFNRPDPSIAVVPVTDSAETKASDVGRPVHEQPVDGVYDPDLQRLFADVTRPSKINGIDISVPLQDPFNSSTVPDYTSAGDFDASSPDTRVNAASPGTEVTTSVPDRASETGLRTNKITADASAAPPEKESTASARYRKLGADVQTNKIAAPPIANREKPAQGRASIQGFVKAAKGEPIKGADVRIESRDGKQVLSTVKTDAAGRYISQGLQPGVYRTTLLVNGTVKASIVNTQVKANQPTQLNFDFKPASQARNTAKGGKHMVWVPARTGSHIGGNWVEVDDEGNAHFESNVQTYSVRR
jgi:hypothetical protein